MCGRFALYTPHEAIAARLGSPWSAGDAAARYNIAPGTPIALIRQASPERRRDGVPYEIKFARWGFRPAGVADEGAPAPINARAETVATSRYFREAFAHRRGLVPADGWYEWRVGPDGRKRPYYIRRADGAPLLFAAIWAPTEDGSSCCAILTQPARKEIAHIHDRMPVALDESCWRDWLDPSVTDRAEIRRIARPLQAALEAYPVSTSVNAPANDGPALIEPVGDD